MLRLTLATFADQAVLMTALAVGGEAALPLLWVVFWFLVGAGCRYGRSMLALSCVVAFCGFAGLTHWQPWWRANVAAGAGLMLSVAATSLYLAVLVYRLEKQAATDPLTGLSNRARLEQAIVRTLAVRGAGAVHAALLLIDLDGFKEVNDDHGHAVGDELLRSFAITLASQMRRGDTLARPAQRPNLDARRRRRHVPGQVARQRPDGVRRRGPPDARRFHGSIAGAGDAALRVVSYCCRGASSAHEISRRRCASCHESPPARGGTDAQGQPGRLQCR
ncbi:GGDEF domain-containing protein [Paraburkholderia acidipaludis]|uniref:GGDEF domain-containing protein n=1 Tax=Paraburkholderia acidipaludis TaxID=660537 RepID=UPI0012EB5F8C|nr:GGDEF domain-containing protein [Paraburkholderia acidipaludis]